MPAITSSKELFDATDAFQKASPSFLPDTFAILYLRAERQLRQLCAFLLRTPPHSIHWNHVVEFIEGGDRTPESWIGTFNKLYDQKSFKCILADSAFDGDQQGAQQTIKEFNELRKWRNVVLHCKLAGAASYASFTGGKIKIVKRWISRVEKAMEDSISYGGIGPLSGATRIIQTRGEYRFDAAAPYADVQAYLRNLRRASTQK